jgi:hypothetical protein
MSKLLVADTNPGTALFLDLIAGAGLAITPTPTTITFTNTGGGGGGLRAQFILRPAGPADPANGIYTDWATAHAAAALVDGETVILIDPVTPATPVVVGPAAGYNMKGVSLQGPISTSAQQLAILDIADGVTFTNWVGRTDYLQLDFNGTVIPLFTVDTGGAGDPYAMVSGINTTWRSRGTVEMISVINASVLRMFLDGFAQAGNVDAAGFETFNVVGLFNSITFLVAGAVSIFANTVRGAGSADVEVSGGQSFTSSLGVTISNTQTNLAGGTFSAISGTQTYTATNPGDWGGPGVPFTNQEAIDRMAAVLFANFGAIP